MCIKIIYSYYKFIMTNNNNNNSDKIYLIVGIVIFLCFMSIGAALLIRNITKSDTSKKSPSPSSAQPSPSSDQPASLPPASLPPASLPPASLPTPYTIKQRKRFKPSKMRFGYVNISDGSKSKFSTNSLMSDTTVDACISKCNELEKCTSFQWVPGDKYCNMVSDKPFSQGSLLSTMIETDDRYEIHIKP